MRRTIITVVGIVGFIIICLLCLFNNAERIETDLQARSAAALNAAEINIDPVIMDGRDATLTGTVPSKEKADEAAQIVDDVFGVRVVHNQLQVAPAAVVEKPQTEPPVETEVVQVDESKEAEKAKVEPATKAEESEKVTPAEKTQVDLDALFVGKQIFFELNSADILSESFPLLDKVSEILKNYPDVEVEIGGHTDSTGTDEINEILSLSRARSVKLYLVNLGIDSGRLKTVGYGAGKPIENNSSPAGRSKNRRTEINIVKEK